MQVLVSVYLPSVGFGRRCPAIVVSDFTFRCPPMAVLLLGGDARGFNEWFEEAEMWRNWLLDIIMLNCMDFIFNVFRRKLASKIDISDNFMG